MADNPAKSPRKVLLLTLLGLAGLLVTLAAVVGIRLHQVRLEREFLAVLKINNFNVEKIRNSAAGYLPDFLDLKDDFLPGRIVAIHGAPTHLPDSALNRLPLLEDVAQVTIDFNHRRTLHDELEWVARLPNFRNLAITGSWVDDDDVAALIADRDLQSLVISSDGVTGAFLSHLRLHSITRIALESRLLSSSELPRLAACPSLRELSLLQGPIAQQDLAQITRLKTIKILTLGDQYPEHLNLTSLREMHAEELHFRWMRLKAADLQAMAAMPRLRRLRLEECTLDPDAYQHLKTIGQSVHIQIKPTNFEGKLSPALLLELQPVIQNVEILSR